ncbi:D-alanyl-D-alanine carboxypeptidase [Pararhizobium sp. PWRC1-1]|uniref:D-alanyl-D-alanine carboxypeptidase n=1 Tax=Pararhizobium sp. PWRC1-1 TaxID=2804566 RepID=UPI003CE8BF93
MRKTIHRLQILALHGVLLLCILSAGIGLATAGQAHLVLDANTGKVLAAENANVLNHPASLTKMMTLYLTFEALHAGRLRWDQTIVMSRNGAATEPFKLGLAAGKTLTVKEAVYAMAIRSANDAAEAMGDHLAGSERAFGTMMTQKARALGMQRTVFRNGSGLPDKRQVTTAREMAILAVALMRDFPKEYRIFAQRSFTFRGRVIQGHNRMMDRYPGVDGIKTGFVNASGFNSVNAYNTGGRRVVGVVLGGKSPRSRDDTMAALFDRHIAVASIKARAADSGAGSALPVPAMQPQFDSKGGEIEVASLDNGPAPRLTKPSTTWIVQISASNTKVAAVKLLAQAKKVVHVGLPELGVSITRIEGQSAGLYRARLTGFLSRESAVSGCQLLRDRRFECFVVPTTNPVVGK